MSLTVQVFFTDILCAKCEADTHLFFRPTLCKEPHYPWHYCRKVATVAYFSDYTLFSSLIQLFQLIFSWSQIFVSFYMFEFLQILNSSSSFFPRVMTHAAHTCTIKSVYRSFSNHVHAGNHQFLRLQFFYTSVLTPVQIIKLLYYNNCTREMKHWLRVHLCKIMLTVLVVSIYKF